MTALGGTVVSGSCEERMGAASIKTAHRDTLNALQGLRGVSGLLVVYDHAIVDMIAKAGAVGTPEFGWYLGGLGVKVFFAISGFVMIYAHRQDFGADGATRKFAFRRIVRIVPLYWLVTLFYAANLIATNRSPLMSDLIRSLIFIPFEGIDSKWQPVLGQGWTLNYEMMFYLVFGLSLCFRRGLLIVFSTFLMSSAAHMAGLFGTNTLLAFWSDPIVLYFLGGILIGLARPSISWRPGFFAASGLALAAIAAAAGTALLSGEASTATAVVTPCAALAAVAACCWAGEGMSGNVLSHSAKAIGDATYSIYLTHTLVIGPSAKAVGRLAPGLPIAGFVTLMVVLTVIVGLIVYRFVERPIMTWWATAFRRRGAAGQSPPSWSRASRIPV